MEIKEIKITLRLITFIAFILDKLFNPVFNEDNFDWLFEEPPYEGSIAFDKAITELKRTGIKIDKEVKELVENILNDMRKKYSKIKQKVKQRIN